MRIEESYPLIHNLYYLLLNPYTYPEWREPGEPAPKTTDGKFYTVHLQDATPEDRANIEAHLGLTFTFHDNGKVEWHPVPPEVKG